MENQGISIEVVLDMFKEKDAEIMVLRGKVGALTKIIQDGGKSNVPEKPAKDKAK